MFLNNISDPNQTTNSNHMGSMSDGMTDPDTKTFYENLPFHGIQTPPNKVSDKGRKLFFIIIPVEFKFLHVFLC